MNLEALQNKLGLKFQDIELLELALTHSSYFNENPLTANGSNERLEFLGDAVIGQIVAEELHNSHPGWDEGKLTEARSIIVRESALADVAQQICLGQHLLMGHGEDSAKGRTRPSNLSAALEALTGALFIEFGYETARQVVLELLVDHILGVGESVLISNPKSLLQETAHSLGLPSPTYEIIEEEGKDHDRSFTAQVSVQEEVIGTGTGKRKTLAEREAAANALEKIGTVEPDTQARKDH